MKTNINSVENHIQDVQNLVASAEKFIVNPHADKILASQAEKFVKSASAHITQAKKMITSSEQHLIALNSSAEQVVSAMTGLFGLQKKVAKKKK